MVCLPFYQMKSIGLGVFGSPFVAAAQLLVCFVALLLELESDCDREDDYYDYYRDIDCRIGYLWKPAQLVQETLVDGRIVRVDEEEPVSQPTKNCGFQGDEFDKQFSQCFLTAPGLSLKLRVACEALDWVESKACCNHFAWRVVSLSKGITLLLISYPVSPKRFQYSIQRRIPVHVGATGSCRRFC